MSINGHVFSAPLRPQPWWQRLWTKLLWHCWNKHQYTDLGHVDLVEDWHGKAQGGYDW